MARKLKFTFSSNNFAKTEIQLKPDLAGNMSIYSHTSRLSMWVLYDVKPPYIDLSISMGRVLNLNYKAIPARH